MSRKVSQTKKSGVEGSSKNLPGQKIVGVGKIKQQVRKTSRPDQLDLYSEGIVETIREPLLVLDSGLRVLFANQNFLDVFKVDARDTIGKRIFDLGNQQWDIPRLHTLLERIIPKHTQFNNYRVEHSFPSIGKRIMLLNARRILRPPELHAVILLAFEDITERIHTRQILQDSEERYRRAFETAKDGMLLVDKSGGQILNSNPAAQNLLGYSAKNLSNKRLWEIGFLKNEGDFKRQALQLEKYGVLAFNETTIKTRNGREIPADVHLMDRAKVIQCNLRNITERKILSDKLLENEKRYHELFTNRRSCVALYEAVENGHDFVFKDINAAVERVEKVSRTKVLGRKVTEVFPGIRKMGLLKVLQRVWKTGKEETLPITLYEDERLTGWRENYVYKLSSGEVVSVYEDLTELKQAELEKQRSEEKYRQVVETSQEGIWVTDADFKITYTNPRMAGMLGYSAEEMIGHKVTDYFFKEEMPDHLLRMKSRRMGLSETYERRLLRKNREILWTLVSASPRVDEKGKFSGTFAQFMDITAHKENERANLVLTDFQRQLPQLENKEEVYQLLGKTLMQLVPGSTIAVNELDEEQQAIRMAGVFGLGPIYERTKKLFRIDPSKHLYPLNETGSEEERMFRSGHLEQYTDGLYNLMARKFPKQVCLAAEKQLKITRIYIQGLTSKGNYLGVVAILARGDITPHKKTIEIIIQQASISLNRIRSRMDLAESEDKFKYVFDKSMVGKSLTLLSGELQVNQAFCDLLGFSEQELKGKKWQAITHPDDIELTQREVDTLISGEKLASRFIKRYIKKDGSVVWADVSTSVRQDTHGKPMYFMTAVLDITERKQAEQSLQILYDTQRQLIYLENLEDVVQLVGKKLLELFADCYIVFSVLDEEKQATRVAGLFGFGPIFEKIKRTYKIDPSRHLYLQRDMTPEETRLFRSGRLEEFPGGVYALMTRKFPKFACVAGEKQLKISKIYAQGLIAKGNYLGVIAILARGDISPYKEMIEIIIQQASITFNRIKSRMALEKSEERFRGLYENATIGMYRTTPNGRILMANPTLVKMLGYPSFEELAKRDLNQEGYKTDFPRQEFQRQIEQQGKIQGRESSWKRKDGVLIYVRESASVVRDENGKALYYEGTVEDITERHQAEKEQQESEKRFRVLFEQAAVGVAQLDTRTGRFTDINKKYCEFLGYTKEEMLKKTFQEVTHPDDMQINVDNNSRLIAGEIREFSYDKRYIRKDGSIVWGNLTISPMWKPDEKPLNYSHIAIVQDITERKQAEEKIRMSEERYRNLFEDSPVSLWEEDFSAVKQHLDALKAKGITDLRAYLASHPQEVADCTAMVRVLDVNKATLELIKASEKGDLLNKNLADIVSPQSLEEFRQELIHISNGLTRFNWEGVNQTLNGENIDVSVTWSVAPGYESDLSKVLVSIVDITERKKMEESLEESEKRFRDVAENAQEWIWEVDTKGKYVFASQVVEKILGYTQEEILQKHFYDLFYPEDREASKATAFEIFSTRQPFREFVNRNMHKNGQTIWLSTSALPLLDDQGNLLGYRGADTDITERKQAETEMRRLITDLRNMSETEKKERTFAEALAKNVISLRSTLKTEEILDSIIENVGQVVPADAISIMLIRGEHVQVVRSRGYQERGLADWIKEKRFKLNDLKIEQEVIRSKKYKITPNTDKSKDWATYPETAWIKSHIIAPILEDEQVIGFVAVVKATPDFFTREHAQNLTIFTDQISTALKNARLFEATQRRMNRMQAMTQIDQAINSSLDVNISLEIVLMQAKEQLQADAVAILLMDDVTHCLVFSRAKGFKTDEIKKANLKLGSGLPGRAVMERTTIAITDLNTAPESYFKNMLVEREGFVSYYCAPLITKGQLKGVLEIYFRHIFQADREWLEFLEMLAQQTAIAINNAELLKSLQTSNVELLNAYEATLKGWVDALDMRDQETEGHTQRVTKISLKLAKRMGIKDTDLVNFERGALLHDIGKVAVPDAILKKPGPLTEEEWVIMRRHPMEARLLLSKSKYLLPALDIPYSHHEKWDGSGYPLGLKGEAIPLAARIFAIVDVWDALTSDRPYRKAWTKKKTLAHIKEQTGKHFDPQVVPVFLSMIQEEQP